MAASTKNLRSYGSAPNATPAITGCLCRIRRFPGAILRVDVRVVVEATRQPLQALIAHKLDVAIITGPSVQKGIRIQEAV